MKLAIACVLLAVIAPGAQTPAPRKVNLIQYLQAGHAGIKRSLLAAAEKMPEADYGFKPSQLPETRTYGAVIAHAASGMFDACARATGAANPKPDIKKTLTQKADIVRALADAVALCDRAFSSLTASTADEPVRQGPAEVPRMAVLVGVLAHNAEMWGISTVYLRAKNLVPPGSEKR